MAVATDHRTDIAKASCAAQQSTQERKSNEAETITPLTLQQGEDSETDRTGSLYHCYGYRSETEKEEDASDEDRYQHVNRRNESITVEEQGY